MLAEQSLKLLFTTYLKFGSKGFHEGAFELKSRSNPLGDLVVNVADSCSIDPDGNDCNLVANNKLLVALVFSQVLRAQDLSIFAVNLKRTVHCHTYILVVKNGGQLLVLFEVCRTWPCYALSKKQGRCMHRHR